MESSRRGGSNKSKLEAAVSSLKQEGVLIYSEERGLKSKETEKQYKWHVETFLKWLSHKYSISVTREKVIEMGMEAPRKLENVIIEYLEYMHKQKNLKHSTMRNAMAATLHLLDMNDVMLNRRKIGKFLPPDEKHEQDRAYTRKEIQKLLDTSDSRFKTIILLLANGMRIGALPGLQIRDIKLADGLLPGQPKIYKIEVYARSEKDNYYTFVTPECTKQIDDYLIFREKQGEKGAR